MRRHYLVAGLALSLSACQDTSTNTLSAPPAAVESGSSQGAPRYIVRFRDNASDVSGTTDRLIRLHRGRLLFRYRAALKGFAGEFSAAEVAALSRDPNVLGVELDQIAHKMLTQNNPPSWGLDRVDQRTLPLNAQYNYGSTATGVRVYIVDTGILFSHNDFGGRATTGYDAITIGGTALDCDGHGTHVAGTVGGSSFGVAKGVSLIAVRVLDCTGSGTYAQVIAGVDWVTQQKQANPSIPMVANMSLGGPTSSLLNAAVQNSIAAGVVYAIAAGNDNANACNQSPASTANAITVASSTTADARASTSNYGTCVDIFAPGAGITSAYYTSNTATAVLSGTSMASPHVAGAAALYLALHPAATPATVSADLIANATLNVITNPGTNSPNRLLYTGFMLPPPVPVANYSFTCTNLDCSFDASGSTAQSNATYSWNWGDGTLNGSGKTTTHSFAAAGTYSVVLTVSDAGGSNSRTQSVTVSNPPPGNQPPVAIPVVTCAGLTCTFDGRGSTDDQGVVNWEWHYTVAGTPVSTQSLFTMTFSAGRARTWQLVVRDAAGLRDTTFFTFVTPGTGTPAPVANFTFTCTNLSCNFDGGSSTAQANATFSWAWGDGTANGSGKTTSHAFGAGGTYNVALTVADAGGSNTITKAVTVTVPMPVPVANYTFSCTNLSCSFDASSSTAQANATYGWAWGDGSANGSGKTTTHAFANAGTYSVVLTVTDAGGTNSRTQSVTVSAPPPGNQPPVAVPVVTCAGGMTCTFDARQSTDDNGITSYEWWYDAGQAGPFNTQSVFNLSFKTSKPRTWLLIVRDAAGLSSSRSFTFTVVP